MSEEGNRGVVVLNGMISAIKRRAIARGASVATASAKALRPQSSRNSQETS